jgi:hypothetical protein
VRVRRIQEDRTVSSPSPDEGEVEAVAIGLYFQEPVFNDGSAVPWKELTYHQRQHMREKARSAIAALDAHRQGDKG